MTQPNDKHWTQNGHTTSEPPEWKGDVGLMWVKCPSVTYGGKAYFWTAETPEGRHWVVWNRQTLVWDVTCDKQDYPLVNTGFKTPQKAMKWLEKKLNGN